MSKQGKQNTMQVSDILKAHKNPYLDYHQYKAAEHFGKDYNAVTKEERLFAKKFYS